MSEAPYTPPRGDLGIRAAFPLSDTEVVVVFTDPLDKSAADPALYELAGGAEVVNAEVDGTRVTLQLVRRDDGDEGETLDQVSVRAVRRADGTTLDSASSPRFVRGVRTPMELKVPHFTDRYPYRSTLAGVHASVMCCTGCNGGVHDRNLVVVNNHSGGGWSGIWVQTAKTIEGPYPRWQRVLFAGGVVSDDRGSMTLVDEGWMIVQKGDEDAHHPPPPLPITAVDVPDAPTKSLLTKSLDAAWVQLDDVTVESARQVAAGEGGDERTSLPRNEVLVRDRSGGRSIAWLFQPSGLELKEGSRLQSLRGFVHAEEPGVYVILSDKDEDLIRPSARP